MLQFSRSSVKFISVSALFLAAITGTSSLVNAQPVIQENTEVSVQARVNINQADAATIAAVLDGVGESKAKAIVEYREKHGDFTSLEELSEVKDIGQSTLNKNQDRITLK